MDPSESDRERYLLHQLELAEARAGVAQTFGAWLAVIVGLGLIVVLETSHTPWESLWFPFSWVFGLIAGLATRYLVTYQYRADLASARLNYDQAKPNSPGKP